MRTVIVSKPLPLSAPATTALVNESLGRTLCHPRCWYAVIWAFCSSQIRDAMTPWLRAGLRAVHASRTAKKSRWTCARNTFSSKAGSCAWTAATPESLPSTPSLSMLGAHDPGITCRSEEHTSELQSLAYLVCRLLLEKKKKKQQVLTRL